MKKLQFEQMLPKELEKVAKKKPLIWIPIGTLEWHSYHLPVGLDAMKAHALCKRIAEQAGGVVFPPGYFSVLGLNFPWTFKYNPFAFSHLILKTLKYLHKYGFKVMFIITGHYPPAQVALLMAIAHRFMKKHDAVVVALPEFAMGLDAGYNGDHAAKWETSLMMELYPEFVDKKELTKISGLKNMALFKKGIYGTNPADNASPEAGKSAVETMVENFTRLANQLIENPDKKIAYKIHNDFIKRYLRTELKKVIKNLLNW